MKKKLINKTYDNSELLDLNDWFEKNDWSEMYNESDTHDDYFINKVKQRASDPILNVKERYTVIDGKKYGIFERFYNNQVTFNELVLNDPGIKSLIKGYNNFDKDNQNSNHRSPNDLVHNEYTDSWDEPTWGHQLSIIEENVSNEINHDTLRAEEKDMIEFHQGKVFDEYMNLLICRRNASWIFGYDQIDKNKLVRNFPMLVGYYDSEGLKTGHWHYHSFMSDLIIDFTYENPKNDSGYTDDTNGRIFLYRYYKSNKIPFIPFVLNPLSFSDQNVGEYLSNDESDDILSLEDLIKLDWENTFHRNNVFNFLDNFKAKKITPDF